MTVLKDDFKTFSEFGQVHPNLQLPVSNYLLKLFEKIRMSPGSC